MNRTRSKPSTRTKFSVRTQHGDAGSTEPADGGLLQTSSGRFPILSTGV